MNHPFDHDTRGWHIRLRATNYNTLLEGQIVPYHGSLVYYRIIGAGSPLYDNHAWSFPDAVLQHCLDHQVDALYLYDIEGCITYATDLTTVLKHGTRGKRTQRGESIRLELGAPRWQTIMGWLDDMPDAPGDNFKEVQVKSKYRFAVQEAETAPEPVRAREETLQLSLF